MVLIFSRMIGISIPALSSKTYIRQYIAYHIIDTLRGKYRRNKANQYGGIDVRPDEMTIDKVSLLSIQRKIQSEITKVNA